MRLTQEIKKVQAEIQTLTKIQNAHDAKRALDNTERIKGPIAEIKYRDLAEKKHDTNLPPNPERLKRLKLRLSKLKIDLLKAQAKETEKTKAELTEEQKRAFEIHQDPALRLRLREIRKKIADEQKNLEDGKKAFQN